ncbi:MAG: ABC transporter substrate-binding protein [Phycisphaerales bacterium]
MTIFASLPKWTAILALGLTLLAGGGGCEKKESSNTGGGAGTGGGSPAPSASTDRIKIGHYGSLTGSKATFGKSTDNGIKLAVKEINAAGGVSIGGAKRMVELVSEDTEGKAEKAGTVVTKLITKDKVSAVLGEVASSITLAAAPVAQQYGVPMITPSSTNPDVTKVGDMIFRVCFIDPFQGYACAKFTRENLKLDQVAVLFDQAGAYSVGLKDEYIKAFEGMGGKITSIQAYNEGDSDFKAQLTRIRETKPQAIFVPGYYTEVANIALQARQLGMAIPLIGGDGWDSEDLAKTAGKDIEGSYYSNHYASDQPSAEIQAFVSAYKADFGGSTPDGLAALGYDAARLLFDAMGRATSLNGKDLRDAIAATKDFRGVTGVITLNADRDAVKPAVMVQMKGGVPVYAATVEPKR